MEGCIKLVWEKYILRSQRNTFSPHSSILIIIALLSLWRCLSSSILGQTLSIVFCLSIASRLHHHHQCYHRHNHRHWHHWHRRRHHYHDLHLRLSPVASPIYGLQLWVHMKEAAVKWKWSHYSQSTNMKSLPLTGKEGDAFYRQIKRLRFPMLILERIV